MQFEGWTVYLKVKLCKATEIISSSWWWCWMCHAYLLATNLTVLRLCAYQCKQHVKIVSRLCMAHFVYSCNICTFPRYANKNETLITTHSIIHLLQSFMQESRELTVRITFRPRRSGYTNANDKRASRFLAAGATSFTCNKQAAAVKIYKVMTATPRVHYRVHRQRA